MSTGTISTTVTTTVTVGPGGYPNTLTVTGTGDVAPTAYGAIGVHVLSGLTGVKLVNEGQIAGAVGAGGGGEAGGTGGIGVDLASAAILTNSGTIAGGKGGYAGFGGGYGGNGIDVTAGGTLTNTGVISGGAGSAGGIGGGEGGIGVYLEGGATLTNKGNLSGGIGGYGFSMGGVGGSGVLLNGGTLVNDGTITGGAGGGSAFGGAAAAGDAVAFGTIASTLVLDPGASFVGAVAADASVKDTLELAGTGSGTISLLGTVFTGFTTISEKSGADWTLSGSNTLATGTTWSDSGSLNVTGSLDDAGAATVSGAGVLQVTAGASVLLDHVTMAGGTLEGAANAEIVVGASLANAQEGTITVASGSDITGYGTITGAAVSDGGSLVAETGTLTVATALSGAGRVDINHDATFAADAALKVARVVFLAAGDGTLAVGTLSQVTSLLSGFGTGDVIDLKEVTATSLSFLGGTLTLDDGTMKLGVLKFAGTYTSANFTLTSDLHGGTDINYVATDNAGGGVHTLPGEDLGGLTLAFTWLEHGIY